ncbi:MAG: tetratricopeptide repeat protein [candidate division Zixibacteria bacterium]|nr:tetratricopeptide repeat protein [candidate division Zixibacteria bacterium]
MLKKTVYYLIFVLTLSIPQAEANYHPADSLFKEGNKAYQEGNYNRAIDCYKQIIDSGIKNHRVYYNLGNAYFRQNQLGRAITNYNLGLDLAPRDEDILANLQYIRLFVVDKIKEQSPNLLTENIDRILSFWTTNEMSLIFTVSYFLFVLLLILWIFSRTKRVILNTIVIILLVVFVVSGVGFGLKLYNTSVVTKGVVVADKVDIKSGPGEEWTSQFTAHQGLELVIKGEASGWYQIILPNQVIGWLPEKAVEKI